MKAIWIDDDKLRSENLILLFELYGVSIKHFCIYDENVEKYIKLNTDTSFIILDLMMPPGKLEYKDTNGGDYTGIPVYKEIRKYFNGPIIFYTVHRSFEKFKDLEVSDHKLAYLTKPKSPEFFLEIVGSLLSK